MPPIAKYCNAGRRRRYFKRFGPHGKNDVNDTYVIREIEYGSAEYRAALELRDAVLRRPLGRQLSAKDTECDETACHLVCCLDERLVACLVLIPLAGGDVRMRQVAVAPDAQRRGIGTALVNYAEALARERGFRRMVLNARESAVPFYEKSGYSQCGPRVDILTIPHWEMEKRLDEPNEVKSMYPRQDSNLRPMD